MINIRVYHPKTGLRQVLMKNVDVDNQVVKIDGRLYSYAESHHSLPLVQMVLPTSHQDRLGRDIYEFDYVHVRIWDIKRYPEKLIGQPHKLYRGKVTRNEWGVPVVWSGTEGDMSDKNNLVLSSLGESATVEVKGSLLMDRNERLMDTEGNVVIG